MGAGEAKKCGLCHSCTGRSLCHREIHCNEAESTTSSSDRSRREVSQTIRVMASSARHGQFEIMIGLFLGISDDFDPDHRTIIVLFPIKAQLRRLHPTDEPYQNWVKSFSAYLAAVP